MRRMDRVDFIGEQVELKRRNLLERLSSEMEFAEFVCERAVSKKDWKMLLRKAREDA